MPSSRRKKSIVHVHQHVLRHNLKTGENAPCITVRTGSNTTPAHAHGVEILDEAGNVVARFVTSLHKPLSCGARIWFETHLTVRPIIEEDSCSLSSSTPT